jgi:hypothetical protein
VTIGVGSATGAGLGTGAVAGRGPCGAEAGRRPLQEHRAEDVGAFEQLGRRAPEADLALLEEHGGVGHLQGDVDRLLDEDDRGPGGHDVAHEREELGDDRGRQTERQFVDEQEPRCADEGHGEGQHLLLASAQVAGGGA